MNNIISFINLDNKLKEIFYDLKPEKDISYFHQGIKYYERKLRHFDNIIKLSKDMICNDYNFDFELFENKYIEITNHFLSNPDKNYGKYITSFREDFTKKVRASIFPFKFYQPDELSNLINDSQSLNELLHLLHSYVISNFSKYEKFSDPFYSFVGTDDSLSKGLKNFFISKKEELKKWVGEIETLNIISLENEKIIIIRDLGHATTINLKIQKEEVKFEYHFPKFSDGGNIDGIKEFIKSKKGIFNNKGGFVEGDFYIGKEEIYNDLFEFLKRVPTDYSFFLNGKRLERDKKNITKNRI